MSSHASKYVYIYIYIYIKLRGRPPIWRGGVRILLEHQAPGEEGLQSNGPKAVLEIGVVFGRACGAALTTLSGKNTFRKLWKNIAIYKENMQNIQSWAESPPPCCLMSQKSTTGRPKTSQASHRHSKGRLENAQKIPEDPKGCQKIAGGLPQFFKNEGNTEKETNAKTRFWGNFQRN